MAQNQIVSVQGKVIDASTGQALNNVNISVNHSSLGTSSGQNGAFNFRVNSMRDTLSISHIGYGQEVFVLQPNMIQPLLIRLYPAIEMLDEISIRPDYNIVKPVLQLDSLSILDYEIVDEFLIILAVDKLEPLRQYLYLTSQEGFVFSFREVNSIGKTLKFPDEPKPQLVYLFKDPGGRVLLLAKEQLWTIFISDYQMYLAEQKSYDYAMKMIFPMLGKIGSKYFFQVSNDRYNGTFLLDPSADSVSRIKVVNDEFGHIRYARKRNVRVPSITLGDSLILFNFFDNEMEVFDAEGRSCRITPTLFHTLWYYDGLGRKAYDLDINRFTQEVLSDQSSGRVFSLWKRTINGRHYLKEIDCQTGQEIGTIQIPEFSNIRKVKVHNNTVYFLYNKLLNRQESGLFSMRFI